jgi:hypothetical protein
VLWVTFSFDCPCVGLVDAPVKPIFSSTHTHLFQCDSTRFIFVSSTCSTPTNVAPSHQTINTLQFMTRTYTRWTFTYRALWKCRSQYGPHMRHTMHPETYTVMCFWWIKPLKPWIVHILWSWPRLFAYRYTEEYYVNRVLCIKQSEHLRIAGHINYSITHSATILKSTGIAQTSSDIYSSSY